MLDAVQNRDAAGEPYITSAPANSFLFEVGRVPGRVMIGLMIDPWNGDRTDPAIAEAVNDTARHLEGLGYHVSLATPDIGVSWEALVQASATIWAATTLEPATLACVRYGRHAWATDYAAALPSRAVGAWLERFDVLLTPTLPHRAPAIGTYAQGSESMSGLEWTDRVFRHSPFTPPFNVAGGTAMSVPLASDPATGLPIGLQFAAGFAREDRLLRLAGQLEQSRPWSRRRPRVWEGNPM
ncbi:6-aminohexanoate-cyclic-dimer hydrolase [Burkholderia lata]|uniref:6-aminohexanoate-cyclic-dimer hydrolase n=2 Tax=Burkholderia lata (strain ATCC 17760 / DSM 23089 / LMG 22485 / NCIMB 9086 / R18194 / 383) TaxID=482957 RepID=A0A6P2RYQ4_BURL3|nr:6-aminohexanoate-cyclic-dimer hydrolase [Burkholderia lata]